MQLLQTLNELPDFNPIPGLVGKLVHSDTQTIAFWEMKAGAELPLHHHVHEQIVILRKGELQMQIGDEQLVLRPGVVRIIPSNVPHSANAITDCEIIDVFNPARDDYR